MDRTFAPKTTLSMKAVDDKQVMTQCAEPMCRITIWVEADKKEHKVKCVSCLMRDNLKTD